MFRGAKPISMDNKGRITVPTRYRDQLQDDCSCQVVCTIDIKQKCLLLYPLNEWEQVEKRLMALSDMNPTERRFKRLLLGNASEIDIDSNGRLLLPSHLRAHAELEKDVMLVGLINKFEIWNKVLWDEQMNDDMTDEDFSQSDNLKQFSL